MPLDPESLRVALLLTVMTVASIDLGLAFLMRGEKEASREHNRD